MKRLSLILLFITGSVIVTHAQVRQEKKDNFPFFISKDVHRFTYRNTMLPSLKIALGDVSSTLSKDIHKKQSTRKGYVATTGYPTWTISKGVARQQAERTTQ